jgi:hypothetical protein
MGQNFVFSLVLSELTWAESKSELDAEELTSPKCRRAMHG